MASKQPDAFLSYTRFDDRHDGGSISQFRSRLADAVRAVTGQPFEIFQDVDGIGFGEHWRGKLDQMLDEARFFIPIVTPSYFASEACRAELGEFLRAEVHRGRDDLVLPIYYIQCDVLEDAALRAADPLAAAIHERQRRDWRTLRFEPFQSREVRIALEQLARDIAKAQHREGSAPPSMSAESTQPRVVAPTIRRNDAVENPKRERDDHANPVGFAWKALLTVSKWQDELIEQLLKRPVPRLLIVILVGLAIMWSVFYGPVPWYCFFNDDPLRCGR